MLICFILLLLFQDSLGSTNPASLHKTLANLPKPKNNFEISMPDEEVGEGADGEGDASLAAEAGGAGGTAAHTTDQAELDRLAAESRAAAADAAWKRRSLTLQRALPRPTAINNSVLRPPPSTHAEAMSLTDLQRVSTSRGFRGPSTFNPGWVEPEFPACNVSWD